MEHSGKNKSDHNSCLNSAVISPDLLNKCISGRRGGRLTSIIPSRLLTQGGSKKRVFLPNIPTRQEKPKENNPQEKSKEKAYSDRGRKFRDRGDNNRGRGRGRGELVQLKGSVFGDRTSERSIKKEHVQRYSERSGRGVDNLMQKPKYTPISGTKSDDDEDDESLKDLFKDDFICDDYDSDDLGPVKLPLVSALKCKKEKIKSDISKVKIKEEPDDEMGIVVKQEPVNGMDEKMDLEYETGIKKEKDIKKIKTEIKYEAKEEPFADLFTNNSIQEAGELLFFHFPDCLPRNCFTDEDDDAVETTQKAEVNKDDDNECQKNCKWSLKEMAEGFIGKLQVLKSGRVRLKIGTLYFDVTEGSQVGFLQQAVSLKMTDDSGDLRVLGHIKSKVVCFPSLENLTSCNYA